MKRPTWKSHGLIAALALLIAGPVRAHCDSLDGPVVRDARAALDRADAAPVLKWVAIADEAAVRDALAKTVAVRALGKSAQELADRYFFETVVRLHRASEGEGFTGLKPAGSVDPGIAAADAALEAGAADPLAAELTADIATGLRQRFETALERKKHADESVGAGREYVEAYVEYIHFVEELHQLARQGAPRTHHEETPGGE